MTAPSTTFAVLLSIAALSCSGASETDVLGPLEPSPPARGSRDDGTERPSPAAADTSAASNDDDDDRDDNGKGKRRGRQPRKPDSSCPAEVEDNGSEAKANRLDSCVRGTLSGSNDKDFFRYAPPRAGRMLIAHSAKDGRVQYRVKEENGAPVTGLDVTFTERAPDIDVEEGKAYFFQLSFPDLSGGGGPRSYEFSVTLF